MPSLPASSFLARSASINAYIESEIKRASAVKKAKASQLQSPQQAAAQSCTVALGGIGVQR